jgi:hypothetical protein
MPRYFIWSEHASSFLTVQANNTDDAIDVAKTVVEKMLFQLNLKDEKPIWFEVSTATAQGTATKDLPNAADIVALEIS